MLGRGRLWRLLLKRPKIPSHVRAPAVCVRKFLRFGPQHKNENKSNAEIMKEILDGKLIRAYTVSSFMTTSCAYTFLPSIKLIKTTFNAAFSPFSHTFALVHLYRLKIC